MVLTDYRGLNVTQMAELRRAIKKAGGEFEVVKNTLLELAMKEGLPRKFTEGEPLQGPTAALWTYEDDLAPLKALNDFIKKTDLPKIKLGFWDGQPISIERIKELASLPTMEELKAKLVAFLQSPIYSLNSVLSWDLRKLVCILKTKGGEESGQKISAFSDQNH